MAWTMLVLAGLLEVVWAFSMKASHGFTKPWPSLVTVVAMLASFGLLSLAMRTLPLGTAYTIWTGIGALGAFVLGVIALGEPINPVRLTAALLILAGITLMKSASNVNS
jgi:quaternary ammonium compound-resistance protein SugE